MFYSNRTTWIFPARVAAVLCAALVTTGTMAASPKLQTIDVTPNAKSITVGQKQSFTATGTFSDGSKQALGPDISDIATAGFAVTCALLSSGGVECWGYNGEGMFGDGTTANSLSPRPAKGISTARALAAGEVHACALLASGAIQCWGSNYDGDLGDESLTDSDVPVAVSGINTGTSLGLGAFHSCAVLAGGALQCWGDNDYGQLGLGWHSGYTTVPVTVPGISTATAVGGGFFHSCALLAGGEVQCWGDNELGTLGDGTTTESDTPVTVHGISNAVAIAVGYDVNCALLDSGSVQCWGDNSIGELGNGSNVGYSAVPVTVTGISDAKAISVVADTVCAALRSGLVKCWGWNKYGQLGNGTTKNSNIPLTVQGIFAPTKLAAGYRHNCALFSGGIVRCWGQNDSGQLGNRRYSKPSLPVTVVGTPGVVWTSSDASKATITDRGVATGRAVGSTTITATTAGFINDNAVLTVK